jgi:hypothetical protein
MNTSGRPSVHRVVAAAAVGAALVLGAGGCTLLQPRSRPTHMAIQSLGPCVPSAEVTVLDRGPASLVWPEFRDTVAATARCGEHLIVLDAGSGRQLGSFTAPKAPTMRVSAPPPPLAAGATTFQVSRHDKAVAAYRASISRDLARLRARARQQLAVWVAKVLAEVGDGNDAGLDPTGHSLAVVFDSAVVDLISLQRSGVAVADRKAVVLLGLTGLSDSVPKLSAGLGGACVAVTGFPLSTDLLRAWRSELRWQGARKVVLLTRATSGQLSAVVADCLGGPGTSAVSG